MFNQNFDNINQKNHSQLYNNQLKNMFITALKFNNDQMINLLIQSGININGDNNDYTKSYIYEALRNKNYYIALILVSKGAKTNYKFNKFEGSLIYDVMYIKPCYCIGKCVCKHLDYDRINLIKSVIYKGCQLIFPNSKISPYKYAINNYFPIEICDLIYKASKKQGSTEKYMKPKEDNFDDSFNNTRNDFCYITGYNYINDFANF